MNKFEEVILAHLENIAKTDSHLAGRMQIKEKNIESCCKYIISEVEKTKRNGFADEEVFALARHYYLEDNLEIKKVSAKVIVNQAITGDEKAKSKKEEPKNESKSNQLSLFDLTL